MDRIPQRVVGVLRQSDPCVLVPARIARTIGPENRIGDSFTTSPCASQQKQGPARATSCEE